MFSLRPWQVTFNIIQPLFCTTVRHVIFPRCACIILASPIEIFFWLAVSNPGPNRFSGFPHCHRLHNGISAGLADGQCFDGHHQAKELVAKYSHVHDDVPGKLSTMDLPRCNMGDTGVVKCFFDIVLGPGAVRKVEWAPLAKKWLQGGNSILHTDSAKSYKAAVPGVPHDRAV